MMVRRFAFMFCVFLLGVMALRGWAQTQQGARLAIDHKAFTHYQRRGSPLPIDATIRSPAGIRKAVVFCRPAGGKDYAALPMRPIGEDVFRAVVPDWMTAGEGLEYYITATDRLGQSVSHGFVGFPLLVRLAMRQQQTQEERLRDLQETLDTIRNSRRPTASEQLYRDPILNQRR